MASPTTATRRLAAAPRRATRRSRERERGMGGEPSVAGPRVNKWLSPAQALPFSGLDCASPDSSEPSALHDPDRTRLPAFATRLNDAAKSKILTVQEYFVLAGKSLRF